MKTIELNENLLIDAWRLAMGGTHQAAFRITKRINKLPFFKYDKKRKSVDAPRLIEHFKAEGKATLSLYDADVAWLFAQATKGLDVDKGEGVTPQIVLDAETWAETLGYAEDQSFKDRIAKFQKFFDGEPDEEKKPEVKADAGESPKN
jgi:hypothetical protein